MNIYAAFGSATYLSSLCRSWQPFSYLTDHVQLKKKKKKEFWSFGSLQHTEQPKQVKRKEPEEKSQTLTSFFPCLSDDFTSHTIAYVTAQRCCTEACWLPLWQAPQSMHLGWAVTRLPARRAPARCCRHRSEGTARLVAGTFVQHHWNATPDVCLGKV